MKRAAGADKAVPQPVVEIVAGQQRAGADFPAVMPTTARGAEQPVGSLAGEPTCRVPPLPPGPHAGELGELSNDAESSSVTLPRKRKFKIEPHDWRAATYSQSWGFRSVAVRSRRHARQRLARGAQHAARAAQSGGTSSMGVPAQKDAASSRPSC